MYNIERKNSFIYVVLTIYTFSLNYKWFKNMKKHMHVVHLVHITVSVLFFLLSNVNLTTYIPAPNNSLHFFVFHGDYNYK